jgi:tetratricopeptide (TPR) repeat protein
MRNRPDDIYRQSLLPRFGRRRRQRQRLLDARGPVPEPTPAALPGGEEGPAPAPRPAPAFGGLPERRRRGRSRSRRSPLAPGALILAGMAGVLVFYLALMAFFRWRAKPVVPPATPDSTPLVATAEPEPAVEPAAAATDAQDEQTADLIRRLTQSQQFLARLHEPPYSRSPPEEILRLATERLADTPQYEPLLLDLARRHVERREFERAAALYRRVLEANPGHRDARLALARAHLEGRAYEAAAAVAGWILEQEPFSLESHQILASVHLAIGRPRNAVPHLRAVVEGDSLNVVARNNLAVAYSKIGEEDKAIKMFQAVIEQDGNNPVSYHNLAICLARKEQLAEATDVLRKAARRFGDAFVTAWVNGKDFDAVRGSQPFRNLLLNLGAGGDGSADAGGVLLTPTAAPEPEKPAP